MASNDYHFITTWRLHGTLDEVVAIMADASDLARWWPSVYLAVTEVEPGDEQGIGKTFDLHTRGWLPYTLRWHMRVADIREGQLTIMASGDFTGRGIWTARQDGPCVIMTYDWKIRANKRILRDLSWALKPIFAANHRWAMRQGERSLQQELDQRRGFVGSTFHSPQTSRPRIGGWAVGCVLALGCLYLLTRRGTTGRSTRCPSVIPPTFPRLPRFAKHGGTRIVAHQRQTLKNALLMLLQLSFTVSGEHTLSLAVRNR